MPATAEIRSRTGSSSARARKSLTARADAACRAEPGFADAGRQLQHHATGTEGGQDRQGHQLPRSHDLQQCRLYDQGQRRQRHQHGLLHRYVRVRCQRQAAGMPERRRFARSKREPAHRADLLRRHAAADEGCRSLQHVRPEGLSDECWQRATTSFPFGVWFADAKTLYVADEGDGTNTFDPASGKYTAAAAQTGAGLQKWVFDSALARGNWPTCCRPG